MRGLVLRADGERGRVDLEELAEPTPTGADLLVDGVAVGVCGTDRGLLTRGPRRQPAGRDWLVLGHESLGRVRQAPPGSRFTPGDLVAGLVRRPDPLPCPNCAEGAPDICTTGDFTERGILGQDGYGAERYLLEEEYAVAVSPDLGLAGVLVEPTSIVAKAWERLDAAARRPGGRALILGAGPIGLLAALLAQQRGYDVHVVDQVDGGPKVGQVGGLGATYHRGTGDIHTNYDIVIECTGELVSAAINATGRGGALCLIAGAHRGTAPPADLTTLTSGLVGGNRTFLGVTSSNHHHFETAHAALQQADQNWLDGLLTTVAPLDQHQTALHGSTDTIKAVILLTELERS